MHRLALAALILAAAPAFAQTPDPASPDSAAPGTDAGLLPAPEDVLMRFHYSCEGEKGFDAVFLNTAGGNSFAVVGLEDALIPMELAISASGARYLSVAEPEAAEAGTDAVQYQLWTKGMAATLSTIDGEAETDLMVDCTAE